MLYSRVITRPEFDFSNISAITNFHKKKYSLYRMTMSELYMFITAKLEDLTQIEHYNSFVLINPHYLAYARILVILYFRLPFVGDLIITSITMTDNADVELKKKSKRLKKSQEFNLWDDDRAEKTQLLLKNKKSPNQAPQAEDKQRGQQELYKKLSSFSKEKIEMLNRIIADLSSSNEVDYSTSKEPIHVLCWRIYQSLLPPEDRCIITKKSLLWLVYIKEGESVLFVLLLKEWILYLSKYVFSDPTSKQVYQWSDINGYKEMEETFVSLFKRTKPSKLSDPMLTTSILLLSCNVELINIFIEHTFKHTNEIGRAHV